MHTKELIIFLQGVYMRVLLPIIVTLIVNNAIASPLNPFQTSVAELSAIMSSPALKSTWQSSEVLLITKTTPQTYEIDLRNKHTITIEIAPNYVQVPGSPELIYQVEVVSASVAKTAARSCRQVVSH
jgi:hypothetical protein